MTYAIRHLKSHMRPDQIDLALKYGHREGDLLRFTPESFAAFESALEGRPGRPPRQDRGFGDTIARCLGPVGRWFKRAFKAVTGRPCGCDARQRWLNRVFPYFWKRP